MDWVLGNWLGVATAAIGIWVSWRLRTHPAIRYSFDRFSAGSFFATKRDYTSIRIKNTGTETIDQSHIREPIYAAFSVPCTSAVPTAASSHDIRPSAEVFEILPNSVQLRFLRLEPGDTVVYRVRHEPSWSKPEVLGSLSGNRTAIKARVEPVGLAVTIIGASFLELPALLATVWTLEAWSAQNYAWSVLIGMCAAVSLLTPSLATRFSRSGGDQSEEVAFDALRAGFIALALNLISLLFALVIAVALGLDWHLPEILLWALVMACTGWFSQEGRSSSLTPFIAMAYSVVVAVGVYLNWSAGVMLLVAGIYLISRAKVPSGPPLVDLSEHLLYEALSDSDRGVVGRAPIRAIVAVASASGSLTETELSELRRLWTSDESRGPLWDVIQSDARCGSLDKQIESALALSSKPDKMVQALVDANEILRNGLSVTQVQRFWVFVLSAAATVSLSDEEGDEINEAEARMWHFLKEKLGVPTGP